MNEKEKVNQITEGVIWKQLLLFFFPIVFGTFFQQIYNTADTIVVGRFVGKQALAAVGGSASQIANLIVGFFVGLSSGAAVVISQFYGAKDKKNLSKALHTAFAFSIAAGIVLTVVGIFLTRPALLLMKTPADVVEDSAVYLHIYFGGMVFNLVYNMGAAILRAVGDSKRPLYVLIITCVLNIILDLLFVVAFGMGVTGVAVATVTSQVISALIVTVMLLKTREIYVLKINQIRFDRRMLFSVLRIGIPAGLESVMYNISNIVIQVFVNNLGTDTVAAWGTLGKIDALFWMVINAFAISITTFVGQNFGAGKYHRMRKSVSVCMIMSMASSAVMIILMYSFAPWIYRLFTTDSVVIVHGVHMSRFLLPSYFIYVIIGILSGALRGTSQVISALIVTVMLLKTREIYVLKINQIRFDRRMLFSVLRIGIPAGLESVMYNISNIVIQVFVNNLGTDTVAAWGTLGKIDALFWMVINAFAISITTFVGQNFGAGKYHRMRKSVSVCMIMSMASSAVMIILMYSFAPWIYRLFTTDSVVIVHGVHMSRFLLPSYFIYVIIGILSGALRGTGKVLVPMLLTCGGVCSLRILWLFTAGQMYPGINTIMFSYPVSWSITAVLFIVYYFMKFPGKKKEN